MCKSVNPPFVLPLTIFCRILWVWTTRPSVRRRDGQLVCQWTALVSVAMRAFLASHRHCGRSSEGQMVHSPLR
ncbi:uncharacterized protein B0H18DRAFT_1032850 [Fomitopsis serialis]|uniref:uncharacterized protein n=1 Tax=Fomitopsis serialis TaxID=139415 RepID=UPI002008E521|nr:uncharacterized protein B0H18DRAFT_1032850 [Neoantrodia serialis]KAH9918011.1 hypothetical protein B0H18DRAFT_1032850 [Neoantrodia serialis]